MKKMPLLCYVCLNHLLKCFIQTPNGRHRAAPKSFKHAFFLDLPLSLKAAPTKKQRYPTQDKKFDLVS